MPPPENSDCRQVLEMLSDYLNLELPPDACRQIADHLAGCQPCEEFAMSLRQTVELCREYQPEEMPRPISESARAELMAAYEKMLAARKQHKQHPRD
jgi:predicted anti-sigma-YlaC factor YlaD